MGTYGYQQRRSLFHPRDLSFQAKEKPKYPDMVAQKYECNLNAVIGKNKENAKFEFSIPSVMGGLTVKFIQGEAPANLVVAGTYDGYTSTSSAYFKDMITADQKVMVTANEDGTVSISYTSDTWGVANISNIAVTKTGTGYTLVGKGTLAMPSMGGGEPKTTIVIFQVRSAHQRTMWKCHSLFRA